VHIKNSIFNEFNSCGSIIRNKKVLLNQYPNALSTYATYPDQYQARAHKKHYELMLDKYSAGAGYSGCTAGACHSITIETSQFLNFGLLKPLIKEPVIVDPADGMHYTG
jgi:hypothetical protein